MKSLNFFRGFTLVEVLVVLGILAIVVTMFVPGLRLSNDTINIESTTDQLYSLFNVIQLQAVNSDDNLIVSFNYHEETRNLESIVYNTVTTEPPNSLLPYVETLEIPAGIIVSANFMFTHILFNSNKTFSYFLYDDEIVSQNLNMQFITNKKEKSIIFYNHSGKIVLDEE